MALPQRRHRRPATRPEAAHPRVLVVDDEPGIRDLLAKTLGLADYEVETAADGPAALERLHTATYDLLIVDLKMPGMDGLTVVRARVGR